MHSFLFVSPLRVKKDFIKGETLRLLRTNSITKKLESSKRDFKFRLLERSYLQDLANKIQAEVQFTSWNNALKYKPMKSKNILPFVTTSNPGVQKLKVILMKKWSPITNNPNPSTNLCECPHRRLQEWQITQRAFGQSFGTFKSCQTLVFSDIQAFSSSQILERQSHISYKRLFSLELNFFRLQKTKRSYLQ